MSSMRQDDFEGLLDKACSLLTSEAKSSLFLHPADFENRVREVVQDLLNQHSESNELIDFKPHPHGFPDIGVGEFGIEVKFTLGNSWRSVANSVLETNRVFGVDKIYVLFGKMGGDPQVRWRSYESCVIHVRTSHVPRFEVDIDADQSLFETMGINYDEFRCLNMADKMRHIRSYARGRLKQGERLWWLEDNPEHDTHSLPINARIYTSLSNKEKVMLRAEAVILCPQIVSSGHSKHKYDDVVLYLLTYHGILCHNARDLFSAGSVANPKNELQKQGKGHIGKALMLIEDDLKLAIQRLPDELFLEYWGEVVPKKQRLQRWLTKADEFASGWIPSEVLFKSAT